MHFSTVLSFVLVSSILLVKPDCIETEVNFNFRGVLPQTEACTVPLPRTPDPALGGGPIQINFGALVESDLLPDLSFTVASAYRSAIDALNDASQMMNSNVQFSINFENTRLNGTYAAEKMQVLLSRGADIILGPLTSDELLICGPLAVSYGTTILSATASPIGLGYAPSVFRLIPDEDDQANALAEFLWKNNYQNAVALYRADAFGIPFLLKFQQAYQNLGGNLSESLSYNPLSYNVTSLLAEFQQTVQAGLKLINAGQPRLAIVMIADGEWQDIVGNIQSPLLLKQFWVGSTGVSRVRQPNAAALAFVQATGSLWATGLYLPTTDLKTQAFNSLRVRGYNNPDPVAYFAYDSVILAGYSVLLSRGTVNPNFSAGLNALSQVWVGSTGRLALSPLGDLIYQRYTLENLNPQTGNWQTSAVFDPIDLTWSTDFAM